MTDTITGKVIIITGASSGLGEAGARLLAARGAKLVLAARRVDRIEALAEELGGDTLAVETDVVSRHDNEALVARALERFGRVDVFVANAGVMPLALLERRDIDDWDRMIDVNLKGVLYGIAAVLPRMIAAKSGHIVTVSSVAGHKVRAGSAVYAATKHAVRALTDGLRQEMTPHGIRATIISPGAVATELSNSITDATVRARAETMYQMAIPADSFARALAFALEQPVDVGVNEILFRPVLQEY